jgi:hypothetical protein
MWVSCHRLLSNRRPMRAAHGTLAGSCSTGNSLGAQRISNQTTAKAAAATHSCRSRATGSNHQPWQRAEQLHRLENGAPVAVAGAHLKTDGSLTGLRLETIQPADGLPDGLLDRFIATIEVGMGLEDSINQPVGPIRLVARLKPLAAQGCHRRWSFDNDSARVTDQRLSPWIPGTMGWEPISRSAASAQQ